MSEIKLYKSPIKGLKIVALSLPFIAIGIWMVTKEHIEMFMYLMGWASIFFFGLGLIIGFIQTFDKRPQIIITETGIWDRTTNQDEIKWEHIKEAYPIDIHGQKFVSLVTDDAFVFKKKPYKWATQINKFVGAQNLNLNLSQIKINEVEFTNFINKLCKQTTEERSVSIQNFRLK